MNRCVVIKTAMTAVLLMLVITVSGTTSIPFLQPTAKAAWEKTVLQGWYFDRPSDGTSTSTVAQRASWISLTRGNSWRNDLRSAGYKGEIIQYFMGMEVQGPGAYKNSSASCNSSYRPANNTVAYNAGDFCRYIHPNESWFLHNGRGERIVASRGSSSSNYQMNPTSSGWRQFVRQRVQRDLFGDGEQAKLGFDGIFFDNIALRLYKLQRQNKNSDGTVKEYSSGDDNAYRRDVVSFLAYQRAGMNGRPLSANLIDYYNVSVSEYLRFTDQLDGYMNEAWGTYYLGREWSDDQWNDIMTIAETTLRQGKQLIALAQGNKSDNTRQTFGLASYLLVSNGSRAYFRYAYLNEPYTNWWQYSNYGVKLGAPKGARYQSGNLWRRDFACGYVTVDAVSKRGTIVQQSCSGESNPTPVPSATPRPSASPSASASPRPSASPSPSASPGSGFSVPGLIQAEDYWSFSDTTSGNQGGAYRNDDVDIQSCSDGSGCYNISSVRSGEWLGYRINVAQSGTHTIQLRIAANDAGQRVRVELDGQNLTGTWSLPGTGDWNSWQTVSKQVTLPAGVHDLRITAESGYWNLNYIDIRR